LKKIRKFWSTAGFVETCDLATGALDFKSSEELIVKIKMQLVKFRKNKKRKADQQV
jgi:hypothetical protein